MIPPNFLGICSLFSDIQLHLHFCMSSALYMLHRYDLLKRTILYIKFNLHILLTLETLPKSDNYCLVGFIFRNQLTFAATLAILKSVKRYSFNPLYNPYILIIYTPLNEKRPPRGRFSFYAQSRECAGRSPARSHSPVQRNYTALRVIPPSSYRSLPCHQLRTVLTRNPASRNTMIYGTRNTNTRNTTESTRQITTTTIQVNSQAGILTRFSSDESV